MVSTVRCRRPNRYYLKTCIETFLLGPSIFGVSNLMQVIQRLTVGQEKQSAGGTISRKSSNPITSSSTDRYLMMITCFFENILLGNYQTLIKIHILLL